ncbi:MAG: sigma-70 family RNA polymerase sigma factor [Gemmatimonadetes bacterium]|nr:sigma-70 family RNA polymerase sigma factor [Gemmatimonadota bacterium]MBK9068312.1 sigma-70 family RNA polymerase sigma factor [Gemmatimonadota bacterium]
MMARAAHGPDDGPRGFPATRYSVVAALADADPEVRRVAFDALVSAYWRAVYLHLRWRWHQLPQDAEDLTQEFFARALERDFLQGYDASQARFRTFLRLCLDRFAGRMHRDARRLKRGGGREPLALDFAGAEERFAAAGQVSEAAAEELFHREWVRALFGAAVDALAGDCLGTAREVRFRLFEQCDLGAVDGGARPTYRELARTFDLPETQVTNHLAWARREFRRHVLERLRALCGSDDEFRAEARALLGVDPG